MPESLRLRGRDVADPLGFVGAPLDLVPVRGRAADARVNVRTFEHRHGQGPAEADAIELVLDVGPTYLFDLDDTLAVSKSRVRFADVGGDVMRALAVAHSGARHPTRAESLSGLRPTRVEFTLVRVL